MKASIGPEYYDMLLKLQETDFVLVELNLYLDTHPHDMAALQQYNRCAQHRKQLAEQFELRYGPLMHFGHSYSKHPFAWPDTPWPWQV
ncbi:spore coat protein CotJB [Marinicrinis lubricantis]|uniref:Spore coat protein CotJB n=1 Tax=Marinicrinis lubricantis TaxID=2086470 RepID=A0ABW1IH84_9BACL